MIKPPEKLVLPPDLEKLEKLQAAEPPTQLLIEGSPCGQLRIGLVLKRTYTILPDGRCQLAGEDLQEDVSEYEEPYEFVDPPRVSSVRVDNDAGGFRLATDVVIQGCAYTYRSNVTETVVSVRCGKHGREIRVYGDRETSMGPDSTPRFSEPKPFDRMPIRYDKAYGGVDLAALEAYGKPSDLTELAFARPKWNLETATPYHYPRNPAGVGFMLVCNRESLGQVKVPNLEFPFDPVTPERMVVGHAHNWPAAPLPAAMDWFSRGWFPRQGYLGMIPAPEGWNGPVAEMEMGWTANDLFQTPSIMEPAGYLLRQEYAQAASPGMSFKDIQVGDLFELANLHPKRPVFRFQLPVDVPRAQLGMDAMNMTELEPHLNSVVARPDDERLIMTWCAHTPAHRKYTPLEIYEMRQNITWRNND